MGYGGARAEESRVLLRCSRGSNSWEKGVRGMDVGVGAGRRRGEAGGVPFGCVRSEGLVRHPREDCWPTLVGKQAPGMQGWLVRTLGYK